MKVSALPSLGIFFALFFSHLYALPMSSGATPEISAQRWIQNYRQQQKIPNLDLRRVGEVRSLSHGAASVIIYRQFIDNIEVESGDLRLLTKNGFVNGVQNPVVWFGASLAQPPINGFLPESVTAETALRLAQMKPEYKDLNWTTPRKVIYFERDANGFGPAQKVWKFFGYTENSPHLKRYAFYVDLVSNKILHITDEVYQIDITGNVRASFTPGLLPDIASNRPINSPLPNIRIGTAAESPVYASTDNLGHFILPHDGNSPITINFELISPLVRVANLAGNNFFYSQNITPPGPGSWSFNLNSTEFLTAQMNILVSTNFIAQYLRQFISGVSALNDQVLANANYNGDCNANYGNRTMNFFRATRDCVNTGYSTIVAHEYGHFVVEQLQIPIGSWGQGAFGEGFADALAMMAYDTPIIGANFYTNGNNLREPPRAVIAYPCEGEAHSCGQSLAGTWWEIKQAFEQRYGTENGKRLARQLHSDWMLTTQGSIGSNSLLPRMATEILAIDDDDADLTNGTPNYNLICRALGHYGVNCPSMEQFSFHHIPPFLLLPGRSNSIEVEVAAGSDSSLPRSVQLTYRVNGGEEIAQPMNRIPNTRRYTAALPPLHCLDEVAYYFSAVDSIGRTRLYPTDFVHPTFSARSVVSREIVTDQNFDDGSVNGWVVDNSQGYGTGWSLGRPYGIDWGAPHSDFSGDGQCWLTGNSPEPNGELMGGPVSLTSPDFEVPGYDEINFSYARWLFTQYDGDDQITIEVSGDHGLTWSVLEVVNTTQPQSWVLRAFDLRATIGNTETLRVRFTAMNINQYPSLHQSGMDRIRLEGYTCGMAEGRATRFRFCAADFNHDHEVNADDLTEFLDAFSHRERRADFNHDGDIDQDDYDLFIAAFGRGCD